MEQLSFELTLPTHGVRIKRLESGIIQCFKFTHNRVDWEKFNSEEEALDYIVTPFPSLGWHVELHEVDADTE